MAKDPLAGFCIVIDTREQKPYKFDVPTERKALPAGDYSVKGLEDRVVVERKTLIDAYGTFGKGRKRFEKELVKLARLDFAAVVIESSMLKALRHPPSKVQRFTPKHFNRAWIAWAERHGVQFMFCDNRELAQRQTFILLERFWRDVREGKR